VKQQYSFWPEPKPKEQVITIYLISYKHVCKKIRTVEAKIIPTAGDRKFTWAEYRGHRYLLGSTAFFTLTSAQRSKLGHLKKTVESSWIKSWKPELYLKAKYLINAPAAEL
jgi:hypothetical protein